MVTSITAAITAELEAWESRLPGVSDTSLAAAALSLAARIDGGMADTAVAPAFRELREHVDQIRATLPAEVKENKLTLIRNDDSRRTNRAERKPAA